MQFIQFEDGPLRVWEMPTMAAYVIGADVAEGLEHGDFSSAHVINTSTGLIAAHWHGKTAPDQFGKQLAELGHFYNKALCAVEANNHGLTTLVAMRGLYYPNLYRRRTVDKITNKQTNQLGWYTSRTSKPLMIDELGIALREGELTILCEATINELRGYVLDPAKGDMHGSPFDDRVISLAIANQMRKFVYQPEYAPIVQDEWTLQWFENKLDESRNAVNDDWTLGGYSTRR